LLEIGKVVDLQDRTDLQRQVVLAENGGGARSLMRGAGTPSDRTAGFLRAAKRTTQSLAHRL